MYQNYSTIILQITIKELLPTDPGNYFNENNDASVINETISLCLYL